MVHPIKGDDTKKMMETSLKIELLRQMKRIRFTEESIAEKYSQQKMRCPTHLCTGQEAVPAAVGLVLRKSDFAVSTHRAHGHYLGKGGDLNKMIAEIHGKVTGCSAGKGGSMHLIDQDAGFMGSTAIVGGTIPVGVGLGLSIALKGTDQVSCVFLGDGASEEGVFYESLNFAALKNLPVLFICENNLYSVYSSLKIRQPSGRKISDLAEAIGVQSQYGNGNDAIDIFLQVDAAVKEIRDGKGPRFIEFSTYRWREHCGPNFDNDIGYRSQDEFHAWKEKDPCVLLEQSLINEKIIDKKGLEKIEHSIMVEVEKAFESAKKANFPDSKALYQGLFKQAGQKI